MAVLVILWYQLFLKKKIFEKFFSTIWKLFLAQKLSFLVRINILKFENRSSKNERILLAPFIFSLLAVVLRRYSSRSFADWPTGGYLLPKSSRATSSIYFNYRTLNLNLSKRFETIIISKPTYQLQL